MSKVALVRETTFRRLAAYLTMLGSKSIFSVSTL